MSINFANLNTHLHVHKFTDSYTHSQIGVNTYRLKYSFSLHTFANNAARLIPPAIGLCQRWNYKHSLFSCESFVKILRLITWIHEYIAFYMSINWEGHTHLCLVLLGAAQQDPVQSVCDPYTTVQHLFVHTRMCCSRPVHPGAEWQYPGGEVLNLMMVIIIWECTSAVIFVPQIVLWI